jgi:hypothetical protein
MAVYFLRQVSTLSSCASLGSTQNQEGKSVTSLTVGEKVLCSSVPVAAADIQHSSHRTQFTTPSPTTPILSCHSPRHSIGRPGVESGESPLSVHSVSPYHTLRQVVIFVTGDRNLHLSQRVLVAGEKNIHKSRRVLGFSNKWKQSPETVSKTQTC